LRLKHLAFTSGLLQALAVVLSAAVTVPALAQQPSDPDAARKKLEADQRALQEKRQRDKELQKELGQIREERERINQDSIKVARDIQGIEAKLAAIEQREGELKEQESLIRGSLEQRHGSIAKLLASMQRMGRNPPPVMITRREDALTMVRSAMLLAAAFPELRGQALALADQLNELVRVQDGIRSEREKIQSETTKLASTQAQMQSIMAEKNQTLAERQAEFAEVRRATAEISRSVSDLNELIVKLDRAVAEKTRLGAYEKQLQAEMQREAQRQQEVAVAQPEATPAPSTSEVTPRPTTTIPIPTTPQQPTAVGAAPAEKNPAIAAVPAPSVVLAPSGDRLAMASPGRIQPAIPFHLAKGKLPMPAQGKRILSFGDRAQTGRSNGIVIETRQAAQVTSPNDGWIMYAGEFRSYGQILIINAGGGYNILLAGLSQLDVQVGQFVLAGEPVGKMAANNKSPGIYVEFRKDGQPINPDPWWADGSRKVQG
jgi:septal ring factor EnvC (AmiA/AmiB activator)